MSTTFGQLHKMNDIVILAKKVHFQFYELLFGQLYVPGSWNKCHIG